MESTRTLQHELEVGTKDFSWKMAKRKRDLMLAGQTPVNVKRARRRKEQKNTHTHGTKSDERFLNFQESGAEKHKPSRIEHAQGLFQECEKHKNWGLPAHVKTRAQKEKENDVI